MRVLGGMGVTTCLTFNVYANLAFVSVEPLTSLFASFKILAFDAELFRMACLTNSDSLVGRYATKLLGLPFAFTFMICGAFCMSFVPRLKARASFNLVASITSTLSGAYRAHAPGRSQSMT